MILTETNLVTKDNGPRPAGSPDHCFYCSNRIGSQHKKDCVLRKRTVVVKATIKYTIEVPQSWTSDNIEFHRNEGTWCVDNMIGELKKIIDSNGCLCPITHFEYLREAEE